MNLHLYSSGPMQAFDFVESYLRTIFGFVGITDIHFINAQPMDVSKDMRHAAHKKAIREARELVANLEWRLQPGASSPETLPGLKPAPLSE